MKKFFTMLMVISAILWNLSAQSPSSFKYQAIARDAAGNILANKQITIQVSILSGSATGSLVYTEHFASSTNTFGLVNLEIGKGIVTIGTFSGITWGTNNYFIKISIDPTGGTNFTDLGTSQLLSVPYALYANNAGNSFSGNYNDLSGKPALSPVATSGNYTDLTNKPNLAAVANTGSYADLTNKPALATVAGTGSYSDLTNKPTLALVANTGNYNDLVNKPAWSDSIKNKIPNTSGFLTLGSTAKWDKDSTDNVTLSGNQSIAGDKSFSGNTSFANTIQASAGINANNKNITNVATPVNNQDAANKAYVDILLKRIESLEIATGFAFHDIDGNLYHSMAIGTQVWMTENLKTTHYNNGDLIPLAFYDWLTQTSAYVYYNNTPAYADTFGFLYNYFTVTDVRNLCPTGWHVPNDVEWTTLEDYLGGRAVAGAKLMEAGSAHWKSTPLVGTNITGFTALPGGFRFDSGLFQYVDLIASFWTKTENLSDATQGWYRDINGDGSTSRNSHPKAFGYSVRCVKN